MKVNRYSPRFYFGLAAVTFLVTMLLALLFGCTPILPPPPQVCTNADILGVWAGYMQSSLALAPRRGVMYAEDEMNERIGSSVELKGKIKLLNVQWAKTSFPVTGEYNCETQSIELRWREHRDFQGDFEIVVTAKLYKTDADRRTWAIKGRWIEICLETGRQSNYGEIYLSGYDPTKGW